ncbi:MAG: DUF5615 family PIN-like protein [Chloroflexi bacterium]|nr:DUF5615 family PIN-like protein [Chloroflexota bacterium]
MKIAYLFDENMNPRFRTTVFRYYPEIDVQQIGEERAPALGTSDSEILHYLERSRRVLVTDNRKSMPAHIDAHLRTGHHHWGIFVVSKHAPFKSLADALDSI